MNSSLFLAGYVLSEPMSVFAILLVQYPILFWPPALIMCSICLLPCADNTVCFVLNSLLCALCGTFCTFITSLYRCYFGHCANAVWTLLHLNSNFHIGPWINQQLVENCWLVSWEAVIFFLPSCLALSVQIANQIAETGDCKMWLANKIACQPNNHTV